MKLNKEEKCYQFGFEATISGYGIVYAESEEKAKKKILNKDYEDILDTWDMEIKQVTKIEEN